MAGVSHSALMMSYGGEGSSEVEFLQRNVPLEDFNIGEAHPNRRIFLSIHWVEGGSHTALSSCTIGGVSATIHGQNGHSGGLTGFGVAIVSAVVPTGTTADIVILGANGGNAEVAGWRTVPVNSSITDVDEDGNVGTSGDLDTAVSVEEGGFVIAAYTSSTNASGSSCSWSGADEEFDANTGSVRCSAAWRTELTESAAHQVDVNTGSVGDAGNGMVTVSWR